MGVTRGLYLNNVLTFKDSLMSPAQGTSPVELFPMHAVEPDPGTGFVVYDDFVSLQTQATNGLWAATKGTGGSLALRGSAPLAGGWINIPTAGSSNDYQVLSTQNKVFALAAGLDLYFEAMIQVTEANTNTSSWFVGFTDTLTSGFLQNSGAPPSSYSGAVIWKAQGAMAVKAQTSNGSAQNSSSSLATAVSGTTLIVGGFLGHNDNTTATFTPYIGTVANNGRSLVTIGSAINLTISGLNPMYLAFGVRTASTNAETLSVDYVQAAAGRYYQ